MQSCSSADRAAVTPRIVWRKRAIKASCEPHKLSHDFPRFHFLSLERSGIGSESVVEGVSVVTLEECGVLKRGFRIIDNCSTSLASTFVPFLNYWTLENCFHSSTSHAVSGGKHQIYARNDTMISRCRVGCIDCLWTFSVNRNSEAFSEHWEDFFFEFQNHPYNFKSHFKYRGEINRISLFI